MQDSINDFLSVKLSKNDIFVKIFVKMALFNEEMHNVFYFSKVVIQNYSGLIIIGS